MSEREEAAHVCRRDHSPPDKGSAIAGVKQGAGALSGVGEGLCRNRLQVEDVTAKEKTIETLDIFLHEREAGFDTPRMMTSDSLLRPKHKEERGEHT